jgi:hypothetical protein
MSKAKRDLQWLEYELLPDEEVLWIGQPLTSKIFNWHDLYLIPFSLFWCGFSLFWMAGASQGGLFMLFGIPHVLIGLYMLVGRFFYKYWKKRNTVYGITDHRVFVQTQLLNRSFSSITLETIPELKKSVGADGVGTITFDTFANIKAKRGHRKGMNVSNTGLELFSGLGYAEVPGFYDIPQADEVYRLINELRHGYIYQNEAEY